MNFYTQKMIQLADKFEAKLKKLASEGDTSPEGKLEHASFRQSLNDWASGNGFKAINFNVHGNKFVEVKFNDGKLIPVKEKEFKAKFESLIIGAIQPHEGWVTLEF